MGDVQNDRPGLATPSGGSGQPPSGTFPWRYWWGFVVVLLCFGLVVTFVVLAAVPPRSKTKLELRFVENSRAYQVFMLRGVLPREPLVVQLVAPPVRGLYYHAPSTGSMYECTASYSLFGEASPPAEYSVLIHRSCGLFREAEVAFGLEVVDELTLPAARMGPALPGKELSVFRILLRHEWLDVVLHYMPRRGALYPPNLDDLLCWVPTVQDYFRAYPKIPVDSLSGARGALNMYVGEKFVDFAAVEYAYLPAERASETSLAVWTAFFIRILSAVGISAASVVSDSLLRVLLLDAAISFGVSERAWELYALEKQLAESHLSLAETNHFALLETFRLLRSSGSLRSGLAQSLAEHSYLTLQSAEVFEVLLGSYVAVAAAYLRASSVDPAQYATWSLPELRTRISSALDSHLPCVDWNELTSEIWIPPLAVALRRIRFPSNDDRSLTFELWGEWRRTKKSSSYRVALLFLDAVSSHVMRVEEVSTERPVFVLEAVCSDVLLLVATDRSFQ